MELKNRVLKSVLVASMVLGALTSEAAPGRGGPSGPGRGGPGGPGPNRPGPDRGGDRHDDRRGGDSRDGRWGDHRGDRRDDRRDDRHDNHRGDRRDGPRGRPGFPGPRPQPPRYPQPPPRRVPPQRPPVYHPPIYNPGPSRSESSLIFTGVTRRPGGEWLRVNLNHPVRIEYVQVQLLRAAVVIHDAAVITRSGQRYNLRELTRTGVLYSGKSSEFVGLNEDIVAVDLRAEAMGGFADLRVGILADRPVPLTGSRF